MLESDRRVLGNLSEPVSMPILVTRLMRDAHSPFDRTEGYASVEEDVRKVLDKLVRRGLALDLGRHSDARSMVLALRGHDDAITLPDAKIEALASRLDSGADIRLTAGELYVMSNAGFDALHAPLPLSEPADQPTPVVE